MPLLKRSCINLLESVSVKAEQDIGKGLVLRDKLTAPRGRRGRAAVGTGQAELCRGGKEMKDRECSPASFLERRYVQAQTFFSL